MAKQVVCSAVCLSLSMLASLLFAYTTGKLVQHTPVYRPLECQTISHDFGDPVMDGAWVNVSGTAVKSCRNLNPYSMRLNQGKPSKVYLKDGSEMHPVGESLVVDSSFASQGEGTGGLRLQIGLPFLEAMELLAKEKVQVVAEVNALAEAEMFFLGVGVKIAEESSKFCGFELALMPEQRVGLSACADSLDELVIPDVDADLDVPDLITMSPEMYAYETRRKNLAFGSLMGASAVLAISLMALGVWKSGFRCRRGEDGAKGAREVKIGAPPAEKGDSQKQEGVDAPPVGDGGRAQKREESIEAAV